jgi:hypothetical protein
MEALTRRMAMDDLTRPIFVETEFSKRPLKGNKKKKKKRKKNKTPIFIF